jgi:hypothetical protein
MATRSITKQRTDALLAAAQERAPHIAWRHYHHQRLPVEQRTWFHLVINRKTAEALGVTIQSHLYVFAEVINEATQFITPGGAVAAAGSGDGGQIKGPGGRSSPGASYLS